MGHHWDRPGELHRLAGDLHDLVLALRVGALDLTEGDRTALLLPAAALAGQLADQLDPDPLRRELHRARTRAGLAAARAAGRTGGRPTVLTPAEIRHIRLARAQRPAVPVAQLARVYGVGRATIYRVTRRLAAG